MTSKVLVPILTLLLMGEGDLDSGSPVHPPSGATEVPLDTIVSVSNVSGFNASNVPTTPVVLKSGSSVIDAQMIISEHSISLVPSAFLTANTTYTVEFSNDLSLIIPNLTKVMTSFKTGSQSMVGDDLAMFRNFKSKILRWGAKHDADRHANEATLRKQFSEPAYGSLYYDATYGYYAASEFMGLTGNHKAIFNDYAQLATDIYRENMGDETTPPVSQQPERRYFPAGLYYDVVNDYKPEGAGFTLHVMANERKMSEIDNPSSFIGADLGFSKRFEIEANIRPVSYYLETLLYYERVVGLVSNEEAVEKINKINLAKNAIIKQLTAMYTHQFNPVGHSNGWTNKFTQPFMTGLGADALTDYIHWLSERRNGLVETTGLQTHAEAVAEILPVLKKLGDWLFDADNHVVVIDATGLNIGDEITFTSDIDTFGSGPKTRTRSVIDIDLNAGIIKQVMPFSDGQTPMIIVSGANGTISHTVEEIVKMWIPDLGGSPGAWNDQGGAGLGGAFRYVVPASLGPNDTKPVGGTGPATDLNLLMLSLIGFLYEETCDEKWKTRGDAVFEGGVLKAAWIDKGKQYNQQLKNTFSYISKRQVSCFR